MKPAPEASADLPTRLRQQLILAQVRIMELEDVRDELGPRLAALEQLLTQAQTLADQKTDEAVHLERVRADLQQQLDHLRHMQHVTNQALEEARAALAAAEGREQNLVSETGRLTKLVAEKADLLRELNARHDTLAQRLQLTLEESTQRLARLNTLEAEQRAMKASRSWRWTAWLRSLERAFGERRP
ncbi:MAG: hypothetical protein KIT44_06435 [Opitutaceae bacterium]|nr:hypothetical protein [Opitutaceae bacterium]